MARILLLGDMQGLLSNITSQGYNVTIDPGDMPDVSISDVVASAFAPETIPLIVLGTGTVADWAARQKRPDAVFVKTPEEAVAKLQEVCPVQEMKAVEKHQCPLVLTYSNKGGVGKTTAAVSIALTLADADVKTVICDFDLAAPDIATYFNLKPKRGIEGLADGVNSLVLKATENLWVLPGPVGTEMPRFTGEEIVQAIQELRDSFQVVVGDTPPAPWEKAFLHDLFAAADMVYAIVDQSKFSVRETETYAPTLLMMGVEPARVRIVVNRYNPKLTSLREIEQSFCAGFKKDVRPLPRIAAVIPEGWEEQVKAGYDGKILHQEEWVKVAREIVGQDIQQKPIKDEPKKGVLQSLANVFGF